MDPRLTSLYEIFKVNSRLFLNCLDGMDQDQALWRPNASTNNAVFIAMHMVDARFALARQLGLVLDNPFGAALQEAKRIEDVRHFPSLDEVRAAWKAVTGELRERMKQLAAADLDRAAGTKYPVEDPSVLGAVSFLLHHDTYHLGMLSLLRKQVGLPAMKY